MSKSNPRPIEESIGQTYHRLTLLRIVEITGKGRTRKVLAEFSCTCGSIIERNYWTVRNGSIKSCGCLSTEKKKVSTLKHGLTNHPLYGLLLNAKNRCHNPRALNYDRYGARGIIVCEEWRRDFQLFYDWALANNWSPGLSLERINNDGNYCPENCTWIPRKEQGLNKSSNRLICDGEETLPMAAMARKYSINYLALRSRLDSGWEVMRALTTPKKKVCPRVVPDLDKQLRNNKKKHGGYGTPLYKKWQGMKDRCKPETKDSKHYYTKGIEVCEDWVSDFAKFREWSLKNGYLEGLSLDRKDNYKGYSPENCQWVTSKAQQSNKTTTKKYLVGGEMLTITDISVKLGIKVNTIRSRLKAGWTLERVMKTPLQR